MSKGVPFHTSEHVDYMTPVGVVNRARHVLGEIDLDPASSPKANEVVHARRFYALADQARAFKHGRQEVGDGLRADWHGRVFLNPPGGKAPPNYFDIRSAAALWWVKLLHWFDAGDVSAAIFVGFNLEVVRTTQTRHGLSLMDFPFCVPTSRIVFDRVVDCKRACCGSPSHANVIAFVSRDDGPAVERFAESFGEIGKVVGC